jgi:hypothetical protein
VVERKHEDVERRDDERAAERSSEPPGGDATASLLASQRSAGNQATTRLARALAARKLGPTAGAREQRGIVADLSAVQVREAPDAGPTDALAMARGTEIHFSPGAFDPGNSRGMELIGHEIAHVVQQRAGRVTPPGE